MYSMACIYNFIVIRESIILEVNENGHDYSVLQNFDLFFSFSVRVLRFLCFSPGYTMRALADQGVRSIIITSGTLSPINSFCSELKLYVLVNM